MKKKLLSSLLALAMILSLLPTVAFAEQAAPDSSGGDKNVAEFNGKKYPSLKEALEAVVEGGEGGKVSTVKLLDNITAPETISIQLGQDVIIEGDGHSVVLKPGGGTEEEAYQNSAFVLYDDATLTLDNVNMTIDGAAAQEKTESTGIAFDLLISSTVKLINSSKVTLKNLDSGVRSAGADDVEGVRNVIIDSSQLTASDIKGNFSNGMSLTVEKGSVVDVSKCGSHGLSVSDLTVTDSGVTVSDANYYGIRATGDVSISGKAATVTVDGCAGEKLNETGFLPVEVGTSGEASAFALSDGAALTLKNNGSTETARAATAGKDVVSLLGDTTAVIDNATLKGDVVAHEDSAANLTVTGKATIQGSVQNNGAGNVTVYGSTVTGAVAGSETGKTIVATSTVGSVTDNVESFGSTTADGAPIKDTMDGETVALANGAPCESLAAALRAIQDQGGTIILLKDIQTPETISAQLSKNINIVGNGHSVALKPGGGEAGEYQNSAFVLYDGAILTLDNVKMTIDGATSAEGVSANTGIAFDLLRPSGLQILNHSDVQLKNLDVSIRAAGEEASGKDRSILVKDSSLTADGMTRYFSGGYMSLALDAAKVSVNNCGTFGIAADTLTVTGASEVTVANTAESGIIADQALAISDSSAVKVQNCGTTQGKTAVAIGSAIRNSAITGDTSFALAESASLSVTGENAKIALGAQTSLDNKGEITGQIQYADPTEGQVRIVHMVDGQTYDVQSVAVVTEGNAKTAVFHKPADPSKSGYTFTGWDYGSNVKEQTDGKNSLTVADSKNVYTYEAQWHRKSSGGSTGGGSSSSYSVSVAATTNGSVKVSAKNAAKGSSVTITVTPETGYQLDDLTVTAKNGDAVKVTDKGSDTYSFTMPGSSVTVNATFEKAGATTRPSALPFTDVASGDWFYNAVKYASDQGLMNGVSANQFAPNQPTTRGMIVTMLWRLEGQPATSNASSFTDVDAGQYYAQPISWAAANKIVTGQSASIFDPNGSITREQLSAILFRYAQYKGYDVSAAKELTSFPDAGAVSAYATDAMKWSVGAGLVNGMDGKLNPTGGATRAQVATMFMRFCQTFVK